MVCMPFQAKMAALLKMQVLYIPYVIPILVSICHRLKHQKPDAV